MIGADLERHGAAGDRASGEHLDARYETRTVGFTGTQVLSQRLECDIDLGRQIAHAIGRTERPGTEDLEDLEAVGDAFTRPK